MDDLNDKRILSSGYRVAMRRAEKRRRRMRSLLATLFLVLLVGSIAWVSFGSVKPIAAAASAVYKPIAKTISYMGTGLSGVLSNFTGEEKKAGEGEAKPKIAAKGKPAVVVAAIDTLTGKRIAKSVLVVRFDIEGKKIDGITIPGNTFVNVPGQGQEEIAVAFSSGKDVLFGALAEIVPVKPEGLVEMKYSDYDKMVFDLQIEKALASATPVGIGEAKLKELGTFSKSVRKEEINLIPLPVKTLTVGEQVFYEPNQQEVARLLKLVWGIQQTIVKKPRVIVLNGNGQPGVGAKAAKQLVEVGFEVVETKNADNFDYEQTKILVYGDGKESEKIQEAIGAGKPETQQIPTGVADYAVILGADYK